MTTISIHAPRTGSDTDGDAQAPPRKISIHAPRTGSDDGRRRTSAAAKDFNPRSPHGERPPAGDERGGGMAFQSTLPARGATPGSCVAVGFLVISIHAPRTGSDPQHPQKSRGEWLFQSTLPARGATRKIATSTNGGKNFNPRSPHGERQMRTIVLVDFYKISIHAPRTGSDQNGQREPFARHHISIHAPRTGSDRAK